MNELIDLIFEDSLGKEGPLIHACEIMRSGVVRENPGTGIMEELTPTAITTPILEAKAFDKMLRENPPIRENILVVKDRKGGRTLFCDLNSPKVDAKVRKDLALFTILDRIVQYMIINSMDKIVFDKDGAHSRKSGAPRTFFERDRQLERYNNENVLATVRDDAVEYADLKSKNVAQEVDLNVIVQGVPTRVMFWKDLSDKAELSIEIETNKVRAFGKIGEVFKAPSGFLVVTRDLIQNIPSLIANEEHRRVAFKGFGVLAIREPNVTCSYFGEETPTEILRDRGYDVYVVNLERMEDYREILSLPSNKLCILVYDFNTISKSVNVLKTLFQEDNIIKTHITDNLLGIIV